MPPQGLLPSKNAGILAVARDPEKMQGFWPAAILGPPSAYVASENSFFKKASQLRSFFGGAFWLPSRWSRDTVEMQGIELATIFGAPSAFQHFCETDPRTLVDVFGFSSRWSRDTVEMQGFELAAISAARSDFQNFFEVATGPCKNAVNLACGHFLSSLFSLLSFLCSLPSSLLGADPFLSHPAGPEANKPCCQSVAVVQKASFGDLWRPFL